MASALDYAVCTTKSVQAFIQMTISILVDYAMEL